MLKMASVLYCSFSALLGAFFRCALLFALVQTFYSFLRLVFLNDSLFFFPLYLVPPAAKEGKGGCEFPLCPPWILLLPLCNAGHCVPGGGYGKGLLSFELSISGERFYNAAGDMGALLPCLDHAQTALNLCRFLRVRDAHTEARGQRPNFRAHFNLWWARHG